MPDDAAAVRTLVVWCPDWPVAAAEIVDGVPAAGPVAVLHANRVLACSTGRPRRGRPAGPAQTGGAGPLPGAGRRRPRSRPGRARLRTGADRHRAGRRRRRGDPPRCGALAARGPARYFGGEEQAAEQIVEHDRPELRGGEPGRHRRRGLRRRAGRPQRTDHRRRRHPRVPRRPCRSRRWHRTALTDLLRRLGLRTLGDFAALPAGDVLARFGFDAALAHRLAAGRDHRPARRPPAPARPGGDRDVRRTAGPGRRGRLRRPRPRRTAARAARRARPGLHPARASRRSPPTGEELHRTWRHDGLLDRRRDRRPAALAARRLALRPVTAAGHGGEPRARPPGSIRLRLTPAGVLAPGRAAARAVGRDGAGTRPRAPGASRVQGLLGPDAVVTAVLGGGRGAADQVRLVPWGDERHPRPGRRPRPGRAGSRHRRPPWCCRRRSPPTCATAPERRSRVSARLEVSARPGPARRRRRPHRWRSPAGPVRGRSTSAGGRRPRPAGGPVPDRPRRRRRPAALPDRRALGGWRRSMTDRRGVHGAEVLR